MKLDELFNKMKDMIVEDILRGKNQDHVSSLSKIRRRFGRLDFEDGFLYFKQKQFKDKLYLRCAVSNNLNCKASYVIPVQDGELDTTRMKCIVQHNHPPDELDVQTEKFLDQLKKAVEVMDYYPLRKIYNIVIEGYAELSKLYPYKSVVRRMRYWSKIDKIKVKSEYDEAK